MVFSLNAQAEIYRWVDENGAVVFSDKPQENAEIIKLPLLETYKTPASAKNNLSSKVRRDQKKQGYSEFKISRPAKDETIRNNAGDVTIAVQLTPNLKSGHKIILNVDGNETEISGLSKSYSGIDRGSHNVSAKIINSIGETLGSTGQVMFHLMRSSVLSPAAKARKKAATPAP